MKQKIKRRFYNLWEEIVKEPFDIEKAFELFVDLKSVVRAELNALEEKND